MTTGQLEAADRAHCAALSAWLKALAPLSGWSLLLAAVAIVVLAGVGAAQGAPAQAAWAASGLAALPAVYLAVRVRFDAALFDALADGRLPALSMLDDALAGLGLRRAPSGPRPLDERIAGTRGLVRRLLAAVAVQTALAVAALVIR